VTSAGAVKCWGANANGQVGDNSNMQRLTPVQVSGLTAGATLATAGNTHSCALVSGGVKCWGQNTNGQLGDGTQSQSLVPIDVTGLASGVTAIGAGASHTCARTAATGIQCWGLNQQGQLATGPRRSAFGSGRRPRTDERRRQPAATYTVCAGERRPALLGTTVSVSSGTMRHATLTPSPSVDGNGQGDVRRWLHTCAIAGRRVVLGANDGGQLGDNSNTQQPAPVDVVGLSGGVVAIVTGATHSCGLTTGGVKCWGDNSAGQLATTRRHRGSRRLTSAG
jgi:alpha-tubulin suppressor-like RCC1 family protein